MNIKIHDKYKTALKAVQKDFIDRNPTEPTPTFSQVVEALLDSYISERYKYKMLSLAKMDK
jgi:hypothetical protein